MHRQTKTYFFWLVLLLAGSCKIGTGSSHLKHVADFPGNEKVKHGYSLIFDDEFDQNTIDTCKWVPYYLPQWSSREKSRARYQIKDGRLVLQITKDQEPWCPEFNGEVKCSSLQTGLYAGDIGTSFGQHRFNPLCRVRQSQRTSRLYTPLYGYIEIRAKVEIGQNNVAAFWMIGFEDTPDRSGEICIMEIKGKNVGKDSFVNGYGIHPFADGKLSEEFYEDHIDWNPAVFTIYAAKWQPNQVDFFINNRLVRSVKQAPNYEMQLMLNIYEIPSQLNEDYSKPNKLVVDYVRGYNFD